MTAEKVVIVTGASQGLGASAAKILGRLGVRVVGVARARDNLEKLSEAITADGGKSIPLVADVADPTDCRRVAETAINQFGRIDALINNAGIVGPMASIGNADVAAWRYNIEVNLVGPFYMTHYALPALRETGGRIVTVSSGAARHSIIAASAYCAAKAGVTHFTQVLADEEPGITTVAMRPGVVDTLMQAQIRREGPGVMPADQAEYYLELKRSGKLEPPEVPARAIVWLSLWAPRTWSGRFLNYDDPALVDGVEKRLNL